MPKRYETRLTEKNYREIFLPHRAGWISEHRFLMEVMVRGPIPDSAVVHHRDRDPSNNEMQNLLLVPDEALHTAIHNAIRQGKTAAVTRAEEMCLRFMEAVTAHNKLHAEERFDRAWKNLREQVAPKRQSAAGVVVRKASGPLNMPTDEPKTELKES